MRESLGIVIHLIKQCSETEEKCIFLLHFNLMWKKKHTKKNPRFVSLHFLDHEYGQCVTTRSKACLDLLLDSN